MFDGTKQDPNEKISIGYRERGNTGYEHIGNCREERKHIEELLSE